MLKIFAVFLRLQISPFGNFFYNEAEGRKLPEGNTQSISRKEQRIMGYGATDLPPVGGMPGQSDAAKRNPFAIGALVVGIFNLCAWIFPICGCPLALVGIGLGWYGKDSEQRTLAYIGLGLSVLGLVLSLINAVLGVAIGLSGS
ncbi:MAG: hypothetical protein HC915_07115 [Anaerolineae bacterium]|nr:hypothetical protein [Anaerolineae bacterium]